MHNGVPFYVSRKHFNVPSALQRRPPVVCITSWSGSQTSHLHDIEEVVNFLLCLVNILPYSEKFISGTLFQVSCRHYRSSPIKRICPSHLTFSAQMCLPFFLPKQPHLRYYTILYLSNSSVLSNNFFKINYFKDFLKRIFRFFFLNCVQKSLFKKNCLR